MRWFLPKRIFMHANLLFWKIIAIGITMGFIGFFLDFTTDVEEEPRLSNIYPVQKKEERGNYVGYLTYDWAPKTFPDWVNPLALVPPSPLALGNESSFKKERRRFHHHMQQQSVVCPDLRIVGGCFKWKRITWGFEGFYDICFSKEVEMKRDSCIVYSFGINNDFTFDEGMARYGCHVFSFDPSMDTKDHQHNEKVMFYQTGLSDEDKERDSTKDIRNKGSWKMRRFASIMKDLGHEKKIIDVLKIDIEEGEWIALPDMLADGSLRSHVKQLVMELHLYQGTRQDVLKYYGIAKWLERQGFEIIKQKVPPICSRCFEVTYVNTNLVKLPKIIWN